MIANIYCLLLSVLQISFNLTFIATLCEEGNDTPLQHCCLENPMDRGAW